MSHASIQTLSIELPDARYPVHLGAGLLGNRALWAEILPPGTILVVSDDVVAPLYLDSVLDALDGRAVETLILPAGEQHKSFENWRGILNRLVDIGALRDAAIVALGGGVVGDLAGFAAASYMRGIRFIQAPTTLLAQVDASVGGKTAINHEAGKNLVGAFHQPSAVAIDSATLDTLPDRAYRAGMAEVIKYGVIRDAKFFDWLEAHVEQINQRDPATVMELIARSVRNKAEVVAEDEKELGVRAILNFGHTFAHALETLTDYTRYQHGEAVAIGMVVAARLSEQRGMCPAGRADQIRSLLEGCGLPVAWPREIDAGRAIECMAMDKKALSTGMRLILIEDVGKAVVDSGSTSRDIVRAIETLPEPAA